MSKKEIRQMVTTAVFTSGLYGLYIKQVEYGIEDYILFVDYKGAAHRAIIHYETERPYFNFMGHSVDMDECIRV